MLFYLTYWFHPGKSNWIHQKSGRRANSFVQQYLNNKIILNNGGIKL
jgi:hypothetical protein